MSDSKNSPHEEKSSIMKHFIDINCMVGESPYLVSVAHLMRKYGWEKKTADSILRAYFAKYEKKLRGVFVVTYTFEGKIITKIVSSENLQEVAGSGKIQSLYLIAIRSLSFSGASLDYDLIKFDDPKESLIGSKIPSKNWKQYPHSDVNSKVLKRENGPVDSENIIDITLGENIKPKASQLLDGKVIAPESHSKTESHQNTKQTKTASLKDFFGKK